MISIENSNRYIYVKNNPMIFTDPSGMICFYNQRIGRMSCSGPGSGNGYSGTGPGRNNPDYNSVPFVGPTPRACYIVGELIPTSNLGPNIRQLTPVDTFPSDTRDPSTIYMHGNNSSNDASKGCMIMPPQTRTDIPTGEMICVY